MTSQTALEQVLIVHHQPIGAGEKLNSTNWTKVAAIHPLRPLQIFIEKIPYHSIHTVRASSFSAVTEWNDVQTEI